MFKVQEEQIAVLGICVDSPAMAGRSAELSYHAVQNGRRAIDMLRMVSFDLVLVGLKLPDMAIWDFLRHLKTAFGQQKWALVGGPISDQQEITARMFGATALFDTTPSSDEMLNLVSRVRERVTASFMSGKFTHTASEAKSGIRAGT